MTARRTAALAALPLALVALTACSAGSSSSGSGGATSEVAPAPAGVGGVTTSQDKAAYDASTANGSVTGVTTDRSVIVHADLTVSVDDVAGATTRVTQVAAAHRATISSQSTTDGSTPVPIGSPTADGKVDCSQVACPGGYATSVTTLRVDNAEVDALLRDLKAIGVVLSSSRNADDVTAQVADVDARVANARVSLARIRALMSQATSIGDVVTLEAELSKRQADLESLEAQQRTLADQTAQATVTVSLVSTAAPVPATADTGFIPGLKAGWNALVGASVVALTVVGALLPFAIVLVPLVLLVVWLVRRSSRRSAQPVTDQG